MKKRLLYYILVTTLLPTIAITQQTDTLIQKLDSLSKKTDSAGFQINNTDPQVFNEATKITFKSYFILLGSDFKQQFTSPFHTNKKGWGKVAKFGLVATAVSLIDKPVNDYFINLAVNNPAIGTIGSYVTRFGGDFERYTLLALYSYGFVFKNDKIKTTTLLATQAYITTGALERIIKIVSGRQRPNYIDPKTNKNKPTFHGPLYQFKKDEDGNKFPRTAYSSFPSGHMAVAFAAATVFAMEYSKTPIVGIISYSTATLIGLSRLTENRHWLTDVLCGATLGYLCGKQVVNNFHRYAKIKTGEKKNSVSFNLQYFYGRVIPGMVYKF
jgi:membrane-associated phospholipid phosphatase